MTFNSRKRLPEGAGPQPGTAAAGDLQAQVDALLLEQGAFAPLELLLAAGRLLYADYEAWRRGEVGALDEVLMGRREAVREELEAAAAYARALGLVEQPQELAVAPYSGGASRALRVSNDPRLAALLAGRHVPARSAPQMDLFFDNPVAALVNGLAHAIAAADAAAAARQLDRLYAAEPNHPDLPAFDRLLDALGRRVRPVADCRAELEFLTAIGPDAWRLLGARARDMLVASWRHLAEALRPQPYSPDAPRLHASHAWSEAQAWDEVRASVLAQPQWWRHVPLAVRLIDSALRRRRRAEALSGWFQLCWYAPERAPEALDAVKFPELHALWQRFLETEEGSLAAAAWPALGPVDFPAWLLLDEPALARALPAELPTGASAGEEHYRLVHRWTMARAARQAEEDMALRKALKAHQPALFEKLLHAVEESSAALRSGP
ncbi:MAG: hypothetical protein ACHQIF_05070 [Steroidobacterales bacterium]